MQKKRHRNSPPTEQGKVSAPPQKKGMCRFQALSHVQVLSHPLLSQGALSNYFSEAKSLDVLKDPANLYSGVEITGVNLGYL